jgi:hypothetical protein
VIGVTVMMWARWTLPRLRIDQVIGMCLKYCLPVGAFFFLVATFWQYFHIWSPNDIAPRATHVHEPWTAQTPVHQESEQAHAAPQLNQTLASRTAATGGGR